MALVGSENTAWTNRAIITLHSGILDEFTRLNNIIVCSQYYRVASWGKELISLLIFILTSKIHLRNKRIIPAILKQRALSLSLQSRGCLT